MVRVRSGNGRSTGLCRVPRVAPCPCSQRVSRKSAGHPPSPGHICGAIALLLVCALPDTAYNYGETNPRKINHGPEMLRPLIIRLPPTAPPDRCRADLHPHLLASLPHSNAVPSNSEQMVLSLSLSLFLLPRPDTRHSRPSRTASGLTPATRRARVAASGASTAAAEPDQPASPSDDAAASVTGQTSSRHYDGVLTPPERRCVNRPAGAAPPSWNDPDQGAAGP